MSEPSAAPVHPPRKKRGGWRRVGKVLLILFVLVAAFHRPLFHNGVRLVLIQVAAKQNLKVEVHFSGTIFTNLIVEGVRAVPTGDKPSPVRRIEIARVRLDYSIPTLIKHGVGEFLRSYEIIDADLEIDAQASKSEPEKKQKRALAEDLNNLLAQPALYADRVHIQNFNLVLHSADDVTEIRGFNLHLDPEQVGYFKIAKVHVPGVPTWENLAAETTYAGRNLFIKGLRLAPEIVIDELNFDASQRSQNKGSMALKTHVFGGSFDLSLGGSQLDKKGENLANSYDTTLKIEAADIGLEAATAYFGAPKPPVARLARLGVLFTGEPEKPRTWKGHAGARVEALAFGDTKVEAVEFAATFEKGRAELNSVNVKAGKNTVTLTATAALPESVNDFPQSDVDATLKLDAPDLPALTAMLPEPLAGHLSGGGPIKLSGGIVTTDLLVNAEGVGSKAFGVETAKLALKASKRLVPAGATPFEGLETRITGEVAGVRVQTFAIDTARLDLETHEAAVTLHSIDVRRGENTVTAEGTYALPADLTQAANAPVDAKFSLQVPKLEAFGIVAGGHPLSGHVAGQGTVKLVNGALAGGIEIEGGDFQLGEFKTGPLTAKVKIADNAATIEKLELKLSGTDQISLAGKAGVQPPFAYEGALLVDIKSLAQLEPLLAAFGQTKPVAGALQIDWSGQSDAAFPPPAVGPPLPVKHTGQLSVALTKGRYDKIDLSEIKLAGLYGPGFAQTTELHLVTGQTSFTGALELREGKVRLRDINLQQGALSVLTGYLIVPLDLDHPQQLLPFDQRIAANINATNLDIEKLLAAFNQAAPASGTVTLNVVAGGTLSEPFTHVKLAGRKLKAKAAAMLEPADLDLDLHYSKNPKKELTLNAVVKQPLIQPLTIKGSVPLDLDATIKQGKLDPQMPVALTVQLPTSSLAAVPKFAPQVRRIEGTVGLDVHAAGTVEKPILSGSAAIDLKGARLLDDNVPAIGAFRARLGFAADTLTFNTFDGELGGGTFKLGGNIKLATLTDPIFDLRLQAKEVLLKRDDAITVRADTDIKVTGPLKAGTVGGTVFVTHSRFFKEIDILPIALPGKSKTAPAPRAVVSRNTGVSFPTPPLRDWKFDLGIKTRPGDSFLVRGNLANGAAALDLKLAGIGLAPYLEGSIHIEEFKASLPFSTLTISRGFVYFGKDAPFQPSLEIQADSQLRDYLVHAYVYGTATAPDIQLSSEPPLPYADIVSLLATGTTVGELTGSANALASRAAIIAVQQLYRKIFKPKTPVEDKPADAGSILDRFQFELGALDNRTGGQAVNSRFKLTDNLFLLGDIGVDGQFTGSLKYLIRFR